MKREWFASKPERKMDAEYILKEQNQKRYTPYILFVVIEVVAMVAIIFISYITFFQNATDDMRARGLSALNGEAEQLASYLEKGKVSVQIAAVSVEEEMRSGASSEEIQQLLVAETNRILEDVDENITGIYGEFNGVYLDGLNWIPPADYVPEERSWFKAAQEAGGGVTIIPPYVDAQTGDVCISICKTLYDGKSVISLDVFLGKIQELTGNIRLSGKGYAFVTSDTGLVIAHSDSREIGRNYLMDREMKPVLDASLGKKDSEHEFALDGRRSTVFTKMLDDNWYVYLIVDNDDLYESVNSVLHKNIMIAVGITILVLILCVFEIRRTVQRRAAEEEILRKRELAERSNKLKSDFLASMSHEIRTPINTVLGMNELIQRESTEPDIRKYSTNIRIAGNMLLTIINDILDFSKMESGKFQLVIAPYQTASLLNDTITLLRERAAEKKLEVILQIDKSLPSELIGDDVRIKQIMMNLLSNAVKYTNQGSITFRADGITDAGVFFLRVMVQDTGIGIREEDREKLFSSFARLDEVKNRHTEGTGLGLAITKRLVDQMGGMIQVDSEYGVGSTFTVSIPQEIGSNAPIGDVQDSYEKTASINPSYSVRFQAPTATILVVDDNSLNLDVFKGLLKQTELQIDTADGGLEALALTRTKRYDLIFLDHMMPKLDGIETLHLLRAEKDNPNFDTPVIALTANAISGAEQMYVDEGFTAYLSKPIISYKLEQMLVKLLPQEKIIVKGPMEEPDDLMTVSAGSSEGEFDHAVALQYCGGNEELFRTVLASYVKQGEKNLSALTTAVEHEDLENYRILVHAIKSTSLNIGAVKLSKEAEQQEALAKSGNLSEIHAGWKDFMAHYREVLAQVEQMFPSEAPDQEEKLSLDEYSACLAKLREFIALFEMEPALETIHRLASAALPEGREQDNELFHRIQEALDDFDYEQAEACLTAIEKDGES